MKYISIDEVLAIHYTIIKGFGGLPGIRDFGLLHSAIERPKASFGGEDLYPNIFEKAAALLHSLILNHPFLDGNKRTAYASCARLLIINSYQLKVTKIIIVSYILYIEKNKPSIQQISLWLKSKTRR